MLIGGYGRLAGLFCAFVGQVYQLVEVLGHLLITFSNAVEKVAGAGLVAGTRAFEHLGVVLRVPIEALVEHIEA